MCLDLWLAKSVEIVSFHVAKYKASHFQEREVLFLPDFLQHVKIWLMVPFLKHKDDSFLETQHYEASEKTRSVKSQK